MGGFTTDSGSWGQIATRGKALLDYCAWTKETGRGERGGGGVGRAGNKDRLDIVVYQWGSAFDLAMSSGIRPGGLRFGGVHENGTMMINSSASSRVGKV